MGATAHLDRFQWREDPLDRLRELSGARDYIDWLIETAIAEARASRRPASWADIGSALGMHRQTAWQKYHDIDPEAHGLEVEE